MEKIIHLKYDVGTSLQQNFLSGPMKAEETSVFEVIPLPTICMFRGIKIYINWREHQPPHFHAKYGGDEVLVSIKDLEVLEGGIPSKQLKMLLGWAAFHQEELLENWELAEKQQELFPIEPLR